MGLNNIIKAFLPKDKVFYALFEQVVENLQDMGNTFRAAIEEKDYNKRTQLFKSLEAGEHKNDELTHEIFVELGQNFITPFDREDIHQLAMGLDDVADYILASSKKIILYNVEEMDEFMLQMAVIVQEGINALKVAEMELRNMKRLREITKACVDNYEVENKADDLLDKGISRLFSDNIPEIE